MDFNGYKEVPIYNDDGTVYYQLEITWKEN